MSVNGRSPSQDEVDQLLAIGGGQAGLIGLNCKEGRTADRTEGAHGRVDPTWNHLLSTGKEVFGGRGHGQAKGYPLPHG